jgi:hypothetical protein
MDLPRRITRRYADQVKLRLAGQRYLSEQQERELLLEALDAGLSFEEAKGLLAVTVDKRHAARERTLDRDMVVTIAVFLSGGAVAESEAKSRVKQMMLDHGWKIRGEIIFGTPHWFRKIPAASTRSNITL